MLGISLIVPSIRIEHWDRVLDSMSSACTKYPFEIIFIGPVANTECKAIKQDNVSFIQSLASPNKCQQIGLVNANFDIVTHFADDCIFVPNIIDKCIDKLLEEPDNKKHVVLTKYTEGNNILHGDDYYRLINAYPKAQYINPEWWIFNSAIFWAEYIKYLGGWDTRFQVPCLGHADLAVRAQRDGVKVSFIKESLCHCEHGQSDHMPIELSHGYEDAPLYQYIHHTIPDRIRIDLDNYKYTPEVWRRTV